MRVRPTPSFFVAVLALLVAFSGVAYAGVMIGSAQIKDNSVQSRDIKNRTLVGKDIKKKSLSAAVLKRNCVAGQRKTFGMCLTKASSDPSTYIEAVEDCDERGGRLPTLGELRYIADIGSITWADGNPGQYEFAGTFTTASPIHPTALDQAGNFFGDPSAMSFYHHCLTLR